MGFFYLFFFLTESNRGLEEAQGVLFCCDSYGAIEKS